MNRKSNLVLSAVDIRKHYGSVVAVDGLSLEVAAGEVVGLLGPNGAGKSTVFRIVSGLEPADEGAITFEGEVITKWPMHRRIRAGLSYLPQGPSLFRDLNVVQNLRIAAGKEVENLAAWLEGSGFENLLEAKVGTLSGGMRRRLEVLRCVVQQPKVLLLDEPFSGVEPLHVEFLKRQIIDLRGKGLGVLLTDHAVRQVLPLCDRALIIDRGTVQCSGSPEVVAADHGVRDRYLGHDFSL